MIRLGWIGLILIFALPLHASPPDLAVRQLGKDANDPALGGWIDETTFRLAATGREAYLGSDEASFASVATSASRFVFTARIASIDGPIDRTKIGIAVRKDLTTPARSVHLRYDAFERNRCVQWFMRYHRRPTDHDGSRQCFHDGLDRRFDDPTGLWFRIERDYPMVRLFASRDGREWSRVAEDYEIALLPQEVHVGLIATQGGDGKTQTTVRFDSITFEEIADPGAERFEHYREHWPDMGRWRFVSAAVPKRSPQGEDQSFSAQLLMPEKMDPRTIRGIVWSTGSKEFLLPGNRPMKFTNIGQLRQPEMLDSPEGEAILDVVAPWNHWFASRGWIRVGGYFDPKDYDLAIRRLAEVSGIEHLPNLPFVSTGASFAGGYAAQAAAAFPERCIATAPVIIGQAGANSEVVTSVPHLNVWGSRDGSHLRDATSILADLTNKRAMLGNAPMWTLAHRQHNAFAIVFPFFMETFDQRVPADADATRGPVALKPVDYDAGWYGLIESWQTNAPRVVPVREYVGNPENVTWLPGPRTARVWQAFVSQNPRPVVLFPTFDGTNPFGGPMPADWHISQMRANAPIELVGTGPTRATDGQPLTIRWIVDGEPIDTQSHPRHVYRATARAIPPGLRSIWIETYVEGRPDPLEISRPVIVLFVD